MKTRGRMASREDTKCQVTCKSSIIFPIHCVREGTSTGNEVVVVVDVDGGTKCDLESTSDQQKRQRGRTLNWIHRVCAQKSETFTRTWGDNMHKTNNGDGWGTAVGARRQRQSRSKKRP